MTDLEIDLAKQAGALGLFFLWAHRFLLPQLRRMARVDAAGHLRTHALLVGLVALVGGSGAARELSRTAPRFPSSGAPPEDETDEELDSILRAAVARPRPDPKPPEAKP